MLGLSLNIRKDADECIVVIDEQGEELVIYSERYHKSSSALTHLRFIGDKDKFKIKREERPKNQ